MIHHNGPMWHGVVPPFENDYTPVGRVALSGLAQSAQLSGAMIGSNISDAASSQTRVYDAREHVKALEERVAILERLILRLQDRPL